MVAGFAPEAAGWRARLARPMSTPEPEKARYARIVAVTTAVVGESLFDPVQTRGDLIELRRQRVGRGALDAPPGGLDER